MIGFCEYGQVFTAVGFHLEALRETLSTPDPPEALALVDQTKSLLARCHDEIRLSIWDLRSSDLGRASLGAKWEAGLRDQVARLVESADAFDPASRDELEKDEVAPAVEGRWVCHDKSSECLDFHEPIACEHLQLGRCVRKIKQRISTLRPRFLCGSEAPSYEAADRSLATCRG